MGETRVNYPDVVVTNHGSVSLFAPITRKGDEWIEGHIGDDAQFIGSNLVVEHRYVSDVIMGMIEDGLRVKTPEGVLFYA